MLDFIRRNLWDCPQECRCLAYIALVHPGIWGHSVGPLPKQDMEKLERIQHQAARFITRLTDLRSVDALAGCLTSSTSHPWKNDAANSRIRPTIYEEYKTHNNILQRQANNNSCCFKVPPSKTDQYRGSFFVKTIIKWNTLTDDIINLPTPNVFSSAVGRQRVALNG